MAAVERYLNNPQTTLDGGIDSSVTTLTVAANPTDVPSSGQFRILIGSEYMLVTAVSGLNWTVTRGIEGSTAASHPDLSVIVAILTVQGLLNLSRQSLNGTNISARREINLVDNDNVIWTLTDDPTNNKVDIEAAVIGGGTAQRPLVAPILADFTWANQGVSSVVTSNDGNSLILRSGQPAAGGDNYHCLHHAVTPPYTVIMQLRMFGRVTNAVDGAGPAFFDTVSSKMIPVVYTPFSNAGTITGYRMTTPTSYSGATEFASQSYCVLGMNSVWWKLEDDNTNRKASISFDGYEWILLSSIARTTFMTANRVGFTVNTFTTTTNLRAILSSFEM